MSCWEERERGTSGRCSQSAPCLGSALPRVPVGPGRFPPARIARASCARYSASSCLVCCTRDTDEDAHARRGGHHLHELETSRRVQRAILPLGPLLPPWTDEH